MEAMLRFAFLIALLAVAVCLTATPVGAVTKDSSKSPQHKRLLHKQLKRYYHADGYIKAIGAVAARTIYSPNRPVKEKWVRATRWLMHVRADARSRITKLKKAIEARAHPFVDLCLDKLIRREGGYNAHATNPTSGAYGAPQALPGYKMASAGADWRDNIWTQIRWMLVYVQKYGGSCGALAHSYSYGWY